MRANRMRAVARGVLLVSGFLVAFAFACSLGGCATPAPQVVTQRVQVPVPVMQPCPKPVVPPRPHLPIATITAQSAPPDVERAYVESVDLLEGYAEQLEKLLGK